MAIDEPMGWLAAALTLVTFSMRSIVALRLVAITANIAFIAYGAVAVLPPVLVLHLLLLPCNLIRLGQLLAGTGTRSYWRAGIRMHADRPLGGRHAMAVAEATEHDWLMVSTPCGRRLRRARDPRPATRPPCA